MQESKNKFKQKRGILCTKERRVESREDIWCSRENLKGTLNVVFYYDSENLPMERMKPLFIENLNYLIKLNLITNLHKVTNYPRIIC